MHRWFRISHHRHSGRLKEHEYTSYLPLMLLLMVVGLVLGLYSVSEMSRAASPGPEYGSIGLTGVMPGPAPTVAATIGSPTDQQRFGTSPISVAGTCPTGTLVELFKNDIFAGSSPCLSDGTFIFDIDLLIGENILIARVYDSLNQQGPDSAPVTVYYDALPPQAGPITSLSFGGPQMLINTDAVFRGVFPGKEMSMPIDIIGGTPPYAINVQWGDSTNKIVSRNDNQTFRVTHIYNKPGNYQISIQATDSEGRFAFLTIAAIVNGQPDVTTAASSAPTNQLLLLWPLYAATIAIVISFWLGERREKRVLLRHGLAPHPQT